jgi:MFS family permease
MSTSKEVLNIIPFRKYFIFRLFMTFAINMLTTVIFYQVFKLTGESYDVGMMGLVEFVPFVFTSLLSGYIADIFDRKKIISVALFTYFICVVLLTLLSTTFFSLLQAKGIFLIYVINFLIGSVRGFLGPAQSAFSAQLVPTEMLPQSSNWLTMTWHIGSVGGPAVAGLICGYLGIGVAYYVTLAFITVGFLVFLTIPKQAKPVIEKREPILESLQKGIFFVFDNKILLGALLLDMLAVLFGGAVAMLPEFAEKILKLDATYYGFLRAAPAIGAILMGIYITQHPPTERAGRKLLWAVLGFGAATVVFAMSTNFYLSFIALLFTGLFDNVSMVIRGTIVSLYTPNEMRGRVSAVNGIFISSSNELGAFESGVASRLMGAVPSVLFGGVMTILTVGFMAKFFPTLRDFSIDTSEGKNP